MSYFEIKLLYLIDNSELICYTKDESIIKLIKRNMNLCKNYKILNISDTNLGSIQFNNIDDLDKMTSLKLEEINKINYVLVIGDLNILHINSILSLILYPKAIYILDIYNDTKYEKVAYMFLNVLEGKKIEYFLYASTRTWQYKNLKNKNLNFRKKVKNIKNKLKERKNARN